MNKYFRWQWTRIVIGRHHESVRARAHNSQQIVFMQFWHLAIECKKIARFAYWPDDVDLLRLTLIRTLTLARARARLFHWHNFVIAVVQRRSNQVVHSSIDDRKFLPLRFFDVTHACQKHAGISNKKTTRLNEDPNAKVAQRRHDGVSVIAHAECGSRACGTVIVPPFA